MISILTLEVNYFIVPAVVIFILFVIPFPGLSRYVCRAVTLVERLNFHGVSLLLLLAVATVAGFTLQMLEWRKKYGVGKPRFADLSLEVDWEARKWRHERNMYIHALAAVLSTAIMKFTRLYNALEKQTLLRSETKKGK
ncbi:uncharacterized protein TM35_000441630 [Trypanosoma theileri]|uniref:BAP29/BAP31 transmembrane domain-containing protein n=1 Tax=Trypanosoma theileri TaxID=67003 RepID=A0A1X0NIN7_9TRYP|nr:uncharacterized protein TM35_000441630 [Trypanosoma theileri]ORC84507.1 hypothetical protein TM35_000441630 [Trypanosoma theileri]